MTRPIPDKAEVALEYPDKLYIGTFERSARFDAHLDENGISLTFQRGGDAENKRSVCMHLHYALFAEILRDLAKTVCSMPSNGTAYRVALRNAARVLYTALKVGEDAKQEEYENIGPSGKVEICKMTPEEEVLLLHVME